MAVRTSSSSRSAAAGGSAAWASLLAGIASVAVLPVAVYVTRFVGAYELLDATLAIPVAAGLGIAALALARRVRRLQALRLGVPGGGVVRAGRVLGVVGVCMAASALVSLAVYGLLDYVGSRE